MSTMDRTYGATAEERGFMLIPKSFPELHHLFDDDKEPEKPIYQNTDVAKPKQYPSENLWNSDSTNFQFYPSYTSKTWLETPYHLSIIQPTALGVCFETPYGVFILQLDALEAGGVVSYYRSWNLGLLPLKSYLDPTVLDNNFTLLREMLSEIDSLLMNQCDWDEIDYRKPTSQDINCAKDTLIKFVEIIGYADHLLTKPYISNFEEGGASIKWKIGDRTLYLEVGQNISIYTKTWNESGKRCSIERPLSQRDYLQLWEWVIDADL